MEGGFTVSITGGVARQKSRSKAPPSRGASRGAEQQKSHSHATKDRMQRLFAKLEEQGDGSILRGWRRALDPEGMMEVPFQDFCKAAKGMGLLNMRDLFGTDSQPKVLTLEDLAPEEGALLARFRTWGKEIFGGPTEMFAEFDVDGEGQMDVVAFHAGCAQHGFVGSEEEVEDLFGCCDFTNNGFVREEELLFLEVDRSVREGAVFNTKKSRVKDQLFKDMATAYSLDASRGLPATHRLAQRPWLAEHFERLPTLVHQRQLTWEKQIYEKSVEAQIVFLGHLRGSYGNEVRAWRRGLDPKCTFIMTSTSLRRYCRHVDLPVDSTDLWRALDKDADGMLRLEEFAPNSAVVLATFRHWANKVIGSCAELWDLPQALEIRGDPEMRDSKWPSDKKMLHCNFMQLLEALGWPEALNANTRSTLCASLDFYGCGFVSRDDLEWLDSWKPPDWLYTEPDMDAWDDLRNLMMEGFSHPLQAWRMILDTDNSNQVCWEEFKTACEKLRWRGNIGGAWRALDGDLSGTITMQEYDPQSADLLQSFKEWASENFGSVVRAFKALDDDGSGLLSHKEMKLACQKLKWDGDTRLLFDCLDLGGKKEGGRRVITIKEIEFLDSWTSDPSSKQDAEREAVEQNLTDSGNKIKHVSRVSAAGPGLGPGLGKACSATMLPSLRQLQQNQQDQYRFSDCKQMLPDGWTSGSGFNPTDHGADYHLTGGSLSTARTAYSRSPSKAVSEWDRSDRLHRAYRCAPAAKSLPQMSRSSSSWFNRVLDEPADAVFKRQRKGGSCGSSRKKRGPEKSRMASTGGFFGGLASPDTALPRCASPLFTIIDGL